MSTPRNNKRWTAASTDALRLHFGLWLMRAHAGRRPSPPATTTRTREPEVAEAPPPQRRRKRKQA